MKSAEIRQKFLSYFESNGHTIEPSASLVPHDDKSILFVNAGMVPFKDIFIGSAKRHDKRVVSCQRCVRAGGKHNDLENVGYTARHHTFFEMLGNFSFGDYFKSKAIFFAWNFLTEELKLPKEKLWVSVFKDDDEAFDVWVNEIGFPANRISRCSEKDNFWQMGDTGPCGPCSEIFYDHGEHIYGGPPGTPEEDGDRFIEIWNLVFMQYDRQQDGTLVSLELPGVDTGMGLERLASILQNKNNNYDIDSFQEIIKEVVALTPKENSITDDNASVRVIADHIRSTAFMIVDGILPSNEGRGYVLRRIIRRAIRHGHSLGIADVFFYKLAKVLAKQYKIVCPEMLTNLENVEKALKQEEERFIQTLDLGMGILDVAINELEGTEIDGKTAFKLYDTYGFPVDLTADIARERGFGVDMDGFYRAMEEQKNRARQAGEFDTKPASVVIEQTTDFLGYESYDVSANIIAIIKDGTKVDSINKEDEAVVVLDQSSFYGESGGQVGDSGTIVAKGAKFRVTDTQKQTLGAFEHYGSLVVGILSVGDTVQATVDYKRRKKIMNNHSATHLMHEALRRILGDSVQQKGSLVEADKLRFDFSHEDAISNEDLNKIEEIVNEQILGNSLVKIEESDIETAKKKGAMAFFGEKYGDIVRVLFMGDDNFSVELCGGTHVERLGDIGRFKILSESSIAAGIRRIEAVTGLDAYRIEKQTELNLKKIAQLTKSNSEQVVKKVAQLVDNQKNLEKQITMFKKQLVGSQVEALTEQVKEINGVKLIATEVGGANAKDLSDMIEKLKDKLGSAVIVLASVSTDKVDFVVGVTKDLSDKYNAIEIIDYFASQVDGKGGGRNNMARGSGKNPNGLKDALTSIANLI